jgi:orotate phosphoribosyltransferase
MQEPEARAILGAAGALLTDDHVVLGNGRHGDGSVCMDALFTNTAMVSAVCEGMAQRAIADDIQVVVGQGCLGAILSTWTTHHLNQLTHTAVRSIYAQKNGYGPLFFSPHFKRTLRGKRVLIVESVLTSDGLVRQFVEFVQTMDGNVVGVVALINQDGVKAEDLGGDLWLEALVDVKLSS